MILICLGALRCASAQVQEGWVRTYDTTTPFVPVASVLDRQTNTCVTGTAADDFVTIKYSPSGVQLWADRYGGSEFEIPTAIAADAGGQVWITGVSSTNRGAGNLTTIKYGEDGSRHWVRRFDNPIDNPQAGPNGFVGQAVDSAGNAFVAGTAWPTGASSAEYLTIKYSPDGEEVWIRRYAMPGGYFARVTGIALDAAGNVVVAGTAHGAGGSKFVTVKYDPSGNLRWAAADDWQNSNNFVTGLAVDPSGNVYVTGSSFRGSAGFLTAKYSATGDILWSAFRPPANGRDAVARGLQVDAEGNVIVTGDERRPVSEDYDASELVTVKYDAAGSEVWSARSTFQKRVAQALALDADGNVYVGGCVDCDGFRRLLLLKYAPSGSQLWELSVPMLVLKGLNVDGAGNVRVVDNNYGGPGGSTREYVQTPLPSQPTAVVVPAQAQVLAGSDITFSAVVSGPGPFQYQWKRFGYNLPGQTEATLAIPNVQLAQQGDYAVVVSNAAGYTISPEARLVLLIPPAFSIQPSDQYAVIGNPVTFNTSLRGTEPLFYQWHSDGAPLEPATNSVLVLPDAQPADVGNYTLVVTNAGGSVTSRVARLVFVPPPVSRTTSTPVEIPDASIALPYPSSIAVSGLTGTVAKVVVTLYGLTHYDTPDLDILLEGPRGQTVLLMSDTGGGAFIGATLNIDDDAPFSFSESSYGTGTFTFKPTNVDFGLNDLFPLPAPAGLYGETLSVFNGTDPNGTWRLFVVDDMEDDGGQIAAGWGLTLIGPGQEQSQEIKLESTTRTGDSLTLRWGSAPGLRLQSTPSLTNPIWTDVPGSEGQSQNVRTLSGGNEFFRLFRP